MKTIRMATALLFRLRRAERMDRGQPCPILIAEKPIPCNGNRTSKGDCAATHPKATPVHPELRALGYANVPDFRERTPWGSSTPGQYREAGLPNIWGTIQTRDDIGTPVGQFFNAQGAFAQYGGGGRGRLRCTEGWVADHTMDFNAARSSEVYGRSGTVQPAAYTVRYLIRAAS